MKRQGFIITGVATLMAAALMASCSGDNVAEQVEGAEEVRQTVTVKELTEQLRAYNANIITRQSTSGEAGTQITPTSVRMGIVAADVKGAIRGGMLGGLKGAIVGAAVYSASKAIWKHFFTFVTMAVDPTVINKNDAPAFDDSVGYYHNRLEFVLYKKPEYNKTPRTMVFKADALMRASSAGYAADGGLTDLQKANLARDMERFVRVGNVELPFDDYCAKLKELNPEDGDYIDFAAEYLYIVFYANVDVDEYTREVLFMIDNANADIEDATLLYQCVQVAHASSVMAKSVKMN